MNWGHLAVVSEPALHGALRSYEGLGVDVEAVIADAKVRFCAAEVQDSRNGGGLVYVIARNLAVVRARRARRTVPLDVAHLDLGESNDDPLRILLRAEEVSLVRAAVARLSPANRVVVQAVDLAGDKYDEAAAKLDVPTGTVRSRLHRGRRVLASLLESAR